MTDKWAEFFATWCMMFVFAVLLVVFALFCGVMAKIAVAGWNWIW